MYSDSYTVFLTDIRSAIRKGNCVSFQTSDHRMKVEISLDHDGGSGDREAGCGWCGQL